MSPGGQDQGCLHPCWVPSTVWHRTEHRRSVSFLELPHQTAGGGGGSAGPVIENLTRERGWLLKEERMPVLSGMGDPTVHRTGLDLDPELRVEWGS